MKKYWLEPMTIENFSWITLFNLEKTISFWNLTDVILFVLFFLQKTMSRSCLVETRDRMMQLSVFFQIQRLFRDGHTNSANKNCTPLTSDLYEFLQYKHFVLMQQTCRKGTHSAVHCPNINIFSEKGTMRHRQKRIGYIGWRLPSNKYFL